MTNTKTNSDTALNKIGDYFKRLLKCEVRINIAHHMVTDEVDKVISKVEEIPIIVIGRSPITKIDEKGLLLRDRIDQIALTPLDGSSVKVVAGKYRHTYGQIQVVIITRTQIQNINIAKQLLIGVSDYFRYYYDLDFVLDLVHYRAKDLAYIELLEVRGKEFSDSTDTEIALCITATEYDYQEQYFELELVE